jgi:hypothetical protein
MVAGSSRKAIQGPGMSLRRPPSENPQAVRMTKAGLTNSDGCTPIPASMIQRCAPLISGPNWKAASTSAMPTA